MSRSKNFYQGISLGRVQRSEYDDAKLRDLARHDARLGESLKTVDRARNVMKKSMEAEKHMMMKAGLQANRKTPVTSQGIHTYSRSTSQQHKPVPDARMKRFSVTDMPSDLDRTSQYRKKSATRPPSYHEHISSGSLSKDHSDSHDKLLESGINHQVVGKNHPPHHTETVAAAAFSGASERLRGNGQSPGLELDQNGGSSITTSAVHLTHAPKHRKSLSKIETSRVTDSALRQSEVGVSLVNDSSEKSTDQIGDSQESTEDKTERTGIHEEDFKPRKRATIWETLSTPKYTSMTKSKRNQIEQEFTSSSRLKSYRSSPALYSTTKVKPHSPMAQGKPP